MKQTIIITENPEQQGWNKNTELCMDVTTFLRSDSRMKAGKDYHGVLRRHVICEDFNYNEEMTFVETVSQKQVKRNPQVFHGEYITVTRRGDGTTTRTSARYRRTRSLTSNAMPLAWPTNCFGHSKAS